MDKEVSRIYKNKKKRLLYEFHDIDSCTFWVRTPLFHALIESYCKLWEKMYTK